MSFRNCAAALAVMTTIAVPAPSWAMTGVGGCSSLPEYYRALGALQQGMESACAMSSTEARHILAGYGVPTIPQEVAPVPATRHRRNHTRMPQY